MNDCFRPVSRYWDRLQRPEQLLTALPEVMRVLTSPAETGAVTLCLPQDVQTEAFDFPEALFVRKVWRVPRARPDARLLEEAARVRADLLVMGAYGRSRLSEWAFGGATRQVLHGASLPVLLHA